MSQYRRRLPQLEDSLFLTDGELENSLSLQDGLDVPGLAAFDLLQRSSGRSALKRYYARYAALARSHGIGVVLESATMRANPDWGAILGYDADALAHVQRSAIELLVETRSAFESADTAVVISGTVGPRTDGYNPALRMSAYEAAYYHAPRIETFARTAADMVTARGMSYVEEASGIALAGECVFGARGDLAQARIPRSVAFRRYARGSDRAHRRGVAALSVVLHDRMHSCHAPGRDVGRRRRMGSADSRRAHDTRSFASGHGQC